MARVQRAAPGIRRSAAARGRNAKVRAARARSVGLIGRALQLLPFTESQLHKAFLAIIFAAVLAAGWMLASISGATAVIAAEAAANLRPSGWVEGKRHFTVVVTGPPGLSNDGMRTPLVTTVPRHNAAVA